MRWDENIWWDKKKAGVIRRLMNQGWRIEDGLMKEPTKSLNFDTPWVFLEEALQPHCGLWNYVYFQQFGLIPRFCRNRCHKVVVKPRTVKELFALYHLMKHLNYPGKLGIDRRDYTSARYAAFFYCNSLEGGKERYKQVREAINENLEDGANIPVILKKGCTEMEDPRQGGKASPEWGEHSAEDQEMEDRLTCIFDHAQTSTQQPAWLVNHVMYAWLEHAYATGDPTWAEICDDIFGVYTVTFHNTEEPENGS